jgi:hypothetical protein
MLHTKTYAPFSAFHHYSLSHWDLIRNEKFLIRNFNPLSTLHQHFPLLHQPPPAAPTTLSR